MEIFTTLFESQVLIENWRKEYNQIIPHSALGYQPPAPEALTPSYGSTSLTLNVEQRLGAGQSPNSLWSFGTLSRGNQSNIISFSSFFEFLLILS
jgi:hypothetical protein